MACNVAAEPRRFVPLFNASNSFMSLRLPVFVVPERQLRVELEFRPLRSSDSLLLYAGQTGNGSGDYLALVLTGRHIQLRSAH